MKRVLFIFLDGVGLGEDDARINPLARDDYPTLARLLAGRRAVAASGRLSTPMAELAPVDACMGVSGRPQSATGQAAILSGINAPARLGEHYGPRPDDRVRAVIDEGNLFRALIHAGYAAKFCNAYPPGYFAAVKRGKRLLSAIPYAATSAGMRLHDHHDLESGRALAADFTNRGWRDELGFAHAPVYTPQAGGQLLWSLAQPYAWTFFEHWHTDLLGHRQDLAGAAEVLRTFDAFLGGLLEAADLSQTLIIVASDHGNVEDCRHGKHTENPALALVMGDARQAVAARIHNLTDFASAVMAYLAGELLG